MKFFEKHPQLKKLLGILIVLIGMVAFVTPFTPGAVLLLLVGLGLLGIRSEFMENILPKKK
tara:strand:+ start:511065 stop:511247 length:183 start_codon:yes stop_codon:yes gene_type:complete